MTAILLETLLLWFRVAREIWLESYGLRHGSQLFSDTTLCAYCKHKQKNKGGDSTTLQPTPLLPSKAVTASKLWPCTYTLYITIGCATMHDNKKLCTCSLCILHTKRWLYMCTLPTMHRFIRTKWASPRQLLQSITSTYTLQCLSNYRGCYSYMHANIKINKKHCHTSW